MPEESVRESTVASPQGNRALSRLARAYWIWPWMLAIIAVSIHRGVFGHVHSHTTMDVYLGAGQHWRAGEYLYGDWRGFVYSPLAAAFFAGLCFLAPKGALVVWLLVNVTALLGGILAFGRSCFRASAGDPFANAACLLCLPLAIGNLDVLQANPFVIGAILLAFASFPSGKLWPAAIWIGLATYLKIYPLAAGLLIWLLAPKRLGWRLLIVLAGLAILPFAFQHWGYVSSQYSAWIKTRLSDNRANYSEKDAPLDLWYLLTRALPFHFPFASYKVGQIVAGGAIALYALVARARRRELTRILYTLFCFVSVWMTLLGPATESYTYILLAPAVAIAVAASFTKREPRWMQFTAAAAYAFLLAAVARNSLAPHLKSPVAMSLQPLGALVFLCYSFGSASRQTGAPLVASH